MKNVNENTLLEIADLFKIFSDSTRIKILYYLLNKEESVNKISEDLNMNQSAISHQLRILKSAKLLKTRREGQTIYYSISDNHVSNIINQGMEHVNE